jgi:anti-sigma28 factor (negative regulator of flagellin synthesis)
MASNSSKTSQPKGQVGTIASRSDASIEKSKKPQQNLEREQNVGTAGDTVPIVFCKRASNAGGAWVQPPLIKQGSYNFNGMFLYAISQGDMVDDPEIYRTWSGDRIISHIPSGGTVTATHFYLSSTAMAAAPNVCPMTGGKFFCDADTAYYLQFYEKVGGYVVYYEPNETNIYANFRELTVGEGDTTNSVIVFNGADLTVLEVATGIDRTSEYWTVNYSGADPASVNFYTNAVFSGQTITGGYAVGTTRGSAVTSWNAPLGLSGLDFYQSFYGTTEPVVEIHGPGTLNSQINTSNPASTGTLFGILEERGASTVADPTSFSSSFDFTVFADITFLQIEGNLYDSAPSASAYPTTTRQLSVFYEQGISVDLYSGGLVSGSYATGASNQFVDLAMYLFTLIGRAEGAATADISMPIDVSNLQDIAAFCTSNSTFFNGVIEQSMNVIDYISKVAPYFLLSFISANGQYSIQPLLPVTSGNAIDVTALTPAATFTEANILPGSFVKSYRDADDRREINISLVWRECTPFEVGIQRTTTVRFGTTANDAPTEQFDLTDFCATQAHAEIFGKYQLAKRRHSTHTISFATPLITSGLIPTNVIRVTRQRKNSAGDDRTETDFYQITSIRHSSDGMSTVEAMSFPVDASSIAKISNEIVNGTFEVI